MRAQIIAGHHQHHHVHDGVEHDGQDEGDQQKAGAAARMQRGKGAGVFGGQGQIGLVAIHGFMLRAMIAEHPLHIRNAAAERHIAQQNGRADKAGDQILEQQHAARGRGGKELDDGVWNQHKQADGQAHGQHDGQTHNHLIHALAQLPGQPKLKFGGLLVLNAAHLAAFLQRLHAGAQHHHHADRAAHKRPAHPLMLFCGGYIGIALAHNAAVRAAHRQGDIFRRAHHYALQYGLTADIHALCGLVVFFQGYLPFRDCSLHGIATYIIHALRAGFNPILSGRRKRGAFMNESTPLQTN